MIDLSNEQGAALRQAMREARDAPRYRYPWDGVEEELRREGRSSLAFFGYGSLVNLSSARRTLSEELLRSRRPALAFGARRVFDYEMPAHGGAYGPPVSPSARAGLNVRPRNTVEDALNGVLLEMPLAEIAQLCAREVGYDLEPVPCMLWDRVAEGQPFLAYVLQCPDEPRAGLKRTNAALEPHRGYYRVCRDGALEFGDDFLQLWLSTTYLADQVTPVADWETDEPAGVSGSPARGAP